MNLKSFIIASLIIHGLAGIALYFYYNPIELSAPEPVSPSLELLETEVTPPASFAGVKSEKLKISPQNLKTKPAKKQIKAKKNPQSVRAKKEPKPVKAKKEFKPVKTEKPSDTTPLKAKDSVLKEDKSDKALDAGEALADGHSPSATDEDSSLLSSKNKVQSESLEPVSDSSMEEEKISPLSQTEETPKTSNDSVKTPPSPSLPSSSFADSREKESPDSKSIQDFSKLRQKNGQSFFLLS